MTTQTSRIQLRWVALTGFRTAIQAPSVSLVDSYIGLRLDGESTLGNQTGVRLVDGVQDFAPYFYMNTSVVSGNTEHGLEIKGGPEGDGQVTIERNSKIGTDSTGLLPRGNGGNGVLIEDLPNAEIRIGILFWLTIRVG